MTRALSGFALVIATAVAVVGFQEPGRVPSGPLTFGAFTAEFDPAGTFAMSAPGWKPVKGPWTTAGTQIELAFPKGTFGCQDEGKYAFHREGTGGRFELIADDCKMRRMILDKSVWRRAGEPAPVPARRIVRHAADKLVPLPAAASATHSWPSFRGRDASGVADGHNLPDTWNASKGEHIRWRTQIPGLAHSSPVVWGSQLFVTTAISSRPNASFKPGLYGDGDASDDRSTHRWMIYALDKRTGKILWERTAHTGEPGERRHIKSTYASSTPATDGRIVVTTFGSQGVFAYDVNGNFRWRVELGRLNLGAYDAPTVEWGPASSPIIWNDLVIVQCDTHDDSFLIALKADTGETIWKTERDEIPSWGTPTIVTTAAGPQLVTNASNFIRGYDPRTGEELWRLGRSSKITAPTPILADGVIVVASGRAPERPIFVVRPTARGDITLADGQTNSDSVVWSRTGRGSYMPTPLAYQGLLYVLANNGVLDAYDLATGKELYRERLPYIGSGFSASPVAADGKIYLSAEDGEIVVVGAGPKFNHIATNTMGELLMATPALSEGVMYVRSASTVFAIGR